MPIVRPPKRSRNSVRTTTTPTPEAFFADIRLLGLLEGGDSSEMTRLAIMVDPMSRCIVGHELSFPASDTAEGHHGG